jgi:Zn-dependent protease with chaperone function
MSETTATRIGPLGRAVTLLALAVAWVVAAVLLWDTTVPPLDLDGFDEHRYFGERTMQRAHDYAQGARAIWLLSTIATVAALVVLVRVVPPRAARLGLGRIGSAIVVGMLMLVTLWFVALPFGLASLWWQHHWRLAPFDVFSWLVAQRYALAVGGAFAMLVIVVVVGFAGRFGRLWWIAAAPVFILLLAALVFVSGWLLAADTTAIRDPALQADVTRLAHAEGVGDTPVHVQDVSDWTDQANAFSAGYGPSTNVVLWNTLLDGRFSRGEVNAVVAHELGHVKRRHVAKGLAWFALFALPAGFLVAELTRRRGGVEDPANLPYAMLVFTVIGLVAAPFQNLVSRRYEAEADWIALNTTHNPAAVRDLFRSFERTSLDEPNPPLLDYVWLENHPTIMQRIAMAERYREGRR